MVFKPYETFTINDDLGGGFVARLETHLIVHRKHTPKNTYTPHSVFGAMWCADKPSDEFIDAWLPKARQAAHKLINEGEYQDEQLISGEFQTVTRKFNSWFYWDRNNKAIIGKLQSIN